MRNLRDATRTRKKTMNWLEKIDESDIWISPSEELSVNLIAVSKKPY